MSIVYSKVKRYNLEDQILYNKTSLSQACSKNKKLLQLDGTRVFCHNDVDRPVHNNAFSI